MRCLRLGSAGGHELRIRRGTSLGRSLAAGIFVNGDGVAPLHARVEPDKGGWRIVAEEGDVLVNAESVDSAALTNGDSLTIGTVVFQVGAPAAISRANHRRVAAVLLLAVAAVVLVSLLYRPVASAAPIPQLHPAPNGESVRWEGTTAALDLVVSLADPARALVELELHAPERRSPVLLQVNGRDAGSIEASSKRTIALRRDLRQGRNRITLQAGQDQPLLLLTAAITTTPVPDCEDAACEGSLQAALGRAERLSRERNAAPANLFEAWRWYRRARGYAVGIGGEEAIARVEAQLRNVETALDDRCDALQFAAARHLALDDMNGARHAARRLLEAFPGDEHGCRASGEDLLRSLDDGGA